MPAIPFEALHISKQHRSIPKPYNMKPIGYDTETINGKAYLICSSIDVLHPTCIEEILEWMCRHKNRTKTGFFYNLKYDFQSLLKWLDSSMWETVVRSGEIGIGQYHLFYIPGKMLTIRDKRSGINKSRRFAFFDISQFYGKMSLDQAAYQYLGERKIEHDYDLSDLKMSDMYQKDFIEYCKRDAQLAERLAQHWIDICHNMDLYPKSLASPASVSSRYFLQNSTPITMNVFRNSDHQHFLKQAWNCVNGALITVFKKGFFEKAYEYDINSAYPKALSKLPDLEKGKFFYAKNPPTDSVMGWLYCRVCIEQGDIGFYCPPFPVTRKKMPHYCPWGWFDTYMTLSEFESLSIYYKIDILSGIYWVPTDDIQYIYKDTVEKLYDLRLNSKDENVNYFCKIVLNGFYGKHLERHKEENENKPGYGKYVTGNLFNPFYASYILAECRLQVFKLMSTIPQELLIGCATDSVFTKEPLEISENKILGEWSYAGSGSLLMIGAGVYSMKSDDYVKTKLRGFHTTNKINLFKLIEEQFNEASLIVETQNVVGILESLIQNRPEYMNVFEKRKREINLNFDTKRLWLDDFVSAEDLLKREINSLPLCHGQGEL